MSTVSSLKKIISLTIFLLLFTVRTAAAAPAEITDERACPEYWLSRCKNADTPILSPEEIARLNQPANGVDYFLYDLKCFTGPITRKEIKSIILDGLTYQHLTEYASRCNLDAIPFFTLPRYAVTSQRADLRLLPCSNGLYSKEKDMAYWQHYDYLQGTALDPDEPLVILHTSADKEYGYTVARYYSGWIKLADISSISYSSWLKLFDSTGTAIVTANKLRCNGRLYQMGARLPMEAANSDDFIRSGDISKQPLPFTPANIIRQAFRFKGDEYGWGGMDESVDCSSFVQDIYRSMGINLPRDTGLQVKFLRDNKKGTDLTGLTRAEKLTLLKNAPAGALLYTKGHSMIFLGLDDNGMPVIIHAMSSCYNTAPDSGPRTKYYVRKVCLTTPDYHVTKTGDVTLLDSLTYLGAF